MYKSAIFLPLIRVRSSGNFRGYSADHAQSIVASYGVPEFTFHSRTGLPIVGKKSLDKDKSHDKPDLVLDKIGQRVHSKNGGVEVTLECPCPTTL